MQEELSSMNPGDTQSNATVKPATINPLILRLIRKTDSRFVGCSRLADVLALFALSLNRVFSLNRSGVLTLSTPSAVVILTRFFHPALAGQAPRLRRLLAVVFVHSLSPRSNPSKTLPARLRSMNHPIAWKNCRRK